MERDHTRARRKRRKLQKGTIRFYDRSLTIFALAALCIRFLPGYSPLWTLGGGSVLEAVGFRS